MEISSISYSLGIKVLNNSPPGFRGLMNTMMRPIPRRYFYGKGFEEKLALLLVSEKWSLEELELFQEKRLVKLIEHAYSSVPYYHQLFKANNLHPIDFRDLGDLRKIPVLTKKAVRENFSDLKSNDSESYQPGLGHSSGTTGKSLDFLIDQQNREIELASVWRHLSWAGIRDLNTRSASFRGDFVNEFEKTSRLWRWDGMWGELTFNSYSLNHDNVKKIVRKLNEFKPVLVRGYPHSLYILSRDIQDMHLLLDFKPRAIQTSSELLTPSMRESIEDAFGTRIFDWYSQSEYVVTAGQCENNCYHQTMERGVMDVIEDEWGMENLVGTGLWNFSMPLINYEIGDHVKIENEECGCGRHHLTIRSIEGRLNDMILTTDGRAVSGASISNYYKKIVCPALDEAPEYFKLIQETNNGFLVETFRPGGFSDKSLEQIRDSLGGLLGKDAIIRINQLEKLPISRKWRIVESRIDVKSLGSIMEKSLN